MDRNKYPPASLAWLVWGLAAAFHFNGFFHRIAPAVITDQLMAEFQIGAAGLGNLTAFFFYSYALMQIPAGILADYWGPRKLLAAGALVAACGTFLFASASSILPANLGRLLIGGAVGVAFVAILRLATHWFDARLFATVGGLTLFCGVGGALSAGVPLRFLVDGFGWRPVMFAEAALLLLIGAAIWAIVRDDPAERGYRSFAPAGQRTPFSPAKLWKDLIALFHYRNTWLLFFVSCGLAGPVIAFAGLWGVPFFTTHYGIPTAASAAITSTLFIFYAFGGLLLGFLSDRIGLRKPVLFASSVVGLFCWVPILFCPNLPIWLLTALAGAAGFASGSVIIGFAFVKESVPSRFAGMISGVYNMGSIVGGVILQPAIGWVLDHSWRGTLANGARVYDLAAYRSGFVLLLLCSSLAALAIGFCTETRCRQTETPGGEGDIPFFAKL